MFASNSVQTETIQGETKSVCKQFGKVQLQCKI